jgi:hypothetical protein
MPVPVNADRRQDCGRRRTASSNEQRVMWTHNSRRKRNPKWNLDHRSPRWIIRGCCAQGGGGYEYGEQNVWGAWGEFKNEGISLDNDDQMTHGGVLEALLKPVNLEWHEPWGSRECAICPRLSPPEYGLKADISLKQAVINLILYMQSSDVVIWPAELTWGILMMKAVVCHLLSNRWTLYYKMPDLIFWYNVIASIRPTICIVSWFEYKVAWMSDRRSSGCIIEQVLCVPFHARLQAEDLNTGPTSIKEA